MKPSTLIMMLMLTTLMVGTSPAADKGEMEARTVDPNQAGAPKNVSLNIDTRSSCKGDLIVIADQLIFTLQAPDPMAFPFPGCSMKPEFYKGAQLQNGWRIVTGQYDDALVKYTPPPASSYGWIQQPSGTSLYGQVVLSLPACKAKNDPCWKALSRTVSVTIQGPADKNPYRLQ